MHYSPKVGAAFLRIVAVSVVLHSGLVSPAVAQEVILDGVWQIAPRIKVQFKRQGDDITGELVEVPDSWRENRYDTVGDIVFEGTLSGAVFEGSFYGQPKGDPAEKGCSEPYRVETTFRLTLEATPEGDVARGTYRNAKLRAGCTLDFLQDLPLTLRKVGCKDLPQTITLGRAQDSFRPQIQLAETLKPLDPDDDESSRDGFCHYVSIEVASILIETGGLGELGGDFALSPGIESADISVYVRENADFEDENAFAEVTVDWADSETNQFALELERWDIGFKIYSFAVTFSTTEEGMLSFSEAELNVQMTAEGDVHLHGPVYISGNTASIITYRWNENATDWTKGSWDVGGFGGLRLEVRRSGRFPIAYAGIRFINGDIAKLDLKLSGLVEWDVHGVHFELMDSNLQAELNLRTNTWKLMGGEIRGGFSAQAPMEGQFDFALKWIGGEKSDEGQFSMSISTESKLNAFGATFENLDFQVVLDTKSLTFRKVQGSFAFKHEAFDSAIVIDSFLISDGVLVNLAGKGSVKFQNAFQLSITKLAYDAAVTPAILAVDAQLDLGWSESGTGSVKVEDFKIDQNGEISSFRINAAMNASPVNITFGAAYDAAKTQFKGRFTGDMGGAFEFGGTVLIGVFQAERPFGYGCLGIFFKADKGVPIGQSGLMLLGLHGAIGANASPPMGSIDCERAVAQAGTFYLAGGLTIGDVGGLAALTGTLSLRLGSTSTVGIKGQVDVTRRTPYFVGVVSANYSFGSGNIFGEVGASVNIPPSGGVVSISNNVLAYQIAKRQYRIAGSNLGGTFFSFLDITDGRISLQGPLSDPINSMTGNLHARLSGGSRISWAYPDNFTAFGNGSGGSCSVFNTGSLVLDCDCTNDSFGVGGGLLANFNGQVNAKLRRAGPEGSFKLRTNLSGSVGVQLPSTGWFGPTCPTIASVSLSGRINGRNADGLLKVDGELTYATSIGWSFDVPFSHSF